MGKFSDELAPKFADVDEPSLDDFRPDTLAWVIQKYIQAMCEPGEVGISAKREYMLRFMQRGPLGPVLVMELSLAKLLNYGRDRKANRIKSMAPNARGKSELSGATVGSDFTTLSVVLLWANDYLEMKLNGVREELATAKRKLKDKKIIAKPKVRDRRPTEEELEMLLQYFEAQNKRAQTKINMVDVVCGSVALGRRIGELVSIQRKHINLAEQTYACYQSKLKMWNDDLVLYPEAMAVVKQRLAEIQDHPDAFLWPYNGKSCSQRYIDAKKALGIVDLRLHDNRRECFSRLFEKRWTLEMVQFGVSKHVGDAKTLKRVYTKLKADSILSMARELERQGATPQ